jgi:hypothetical protein
MMNVFLTDQTGKKGTIVQGYSDLVWTERYDTPGTFTMVFDNPNIRFKYPIGSYISHFDTRELMEILDYSIEVKRGEKSVVTATGETASTEILDSRITIPNLGGNRVRATDEPNTFVIPAGYSWNQIRTLILNVFAGHISGDAITDISVLLEVGSLTGEQLARSVERKSLKEVVIQWLSIDGLGIKTRRPFATTDNIQIVIYKGRDVSDKVVISSRLDEVPSAKYFFSKRKHRNATFVSGKYDGSPTVYGSPIPTGRDRRWVYVDADDIEDNTDPTAYSQQFAARSQEAVSKSKMVALTDVKASDALAARYGKDFFIGDTIGHIGDFGVNSKVRVDEFTWTFDNTGVFGYPTLTPVE